MTPYFLVCPDLVVHNDFGFSDKPDRLYSEKQISVCECKREQKGLSCKNRGRCIIAKEHQTWKNVSSKSW